LNGVTGELEGGLISPNVPDIKDLALCNDQNFPASGTNPGSVAILYSSSDWVDSLILRTSSDGGVTFDGWTTIAYQNLNAGYFNKVSLAYGKSPSWNSGRYFVTWENRDYDFSKTGHIYFAHTDPNYNSPSTIPVCLDSLDPSNINLCRNPVISCQYGDMDNDSSNLTSIVLFEKYDQVSGNSEIKGYYNLQSASSGYFRPFTFPNPSHWNRQPNLAFNPYDSTFILTYFDSTTSKLPYLTNNLSMSDPNTWTIVSEGYNDQSNISGPYPNVTVSHEKHTGANVWIADGPGGKGVALFDAQYSTYTGMTDQNSAGTDMVIRAFPNPCDESASVRFESSKNMKATISLYTILGQSIQAHPESQYSSGLNEVKLNTAKLPEGCYICILKTEYHSASIKLLVKHD
jgi:hypothetical protein